MGEDGCGDGMEDSGGEGGEDTHGDMGKHTHKGLEDSVGRRRGVSVPVWSGGGTLGRRGVLEVTRMGTRTPMTKGQGLKWGLSEVTSEGWGCKPPRGGGEDICGIWTRTPVTGGGGEDTRVNEGEVSSGRGAVT